MVVCSVVNVVATASLNQDIDLPNIEKFAEISYSPEVYRGRVAYFQDSINGR